MGDALAGEGTRPGAGLANTLPALTPQEYPGDLGLEERITDLVRWNALAMVVQANRTSPGIGGHLSTFASAANLIETGFHHCWRATTGERPGDLIYFQGHASPGMYARAFLEGRLEGSALANFRRELQDSPGLSSYPHPWLMPTFWQFPTVSMGLSVLQAVYQARFGRYLMGRGLLAEDTRTWAIAGDGEMDEPESLAGLTLAAREGLDQLIVVVNCNLQRLDGPVRGNGSIMDELAGLFGGAGWRVLTVRWGAAWEDLLARDGSGLLHQRLAALVDGDWQRLAAGGGVALRAELFAGAADLEALVADLDDDALARLPFGGHDPAAILAAYRAAEAGDGRPTVILARTVKGYGLGPFGEAANSTHQKKSLDAEGLRYVRSRFGLPLDDDQAAALEFHRPPEDSPEQEYLLARRRDLGGFLPARPQVSPVLAVPGLEAFDELLQGTGDRAVSTTMALVRLMSLLLRDDALGDRIVPIVPDEARTFGMDGIFSQLGIYAPAGQVYRSVDAVNLLRYREAADGQVLEEGITEAGALASFIAAGTNHATRGLPMLPWFWFYSMFGFQRVGDLIWAAADARCRGILVGATAGRTTLNGEGLQHQDGNSLLLASTHPRVDSWDPAYAYELAVIVQDALRRMWGAGDLAEDERDRLLYLLVYNENQVQPALPTGAAPDILRGIHQVRGTDGTAVVHLWGAGSLLPEALRAATILAEDHDVAAAVWSVPGGERLYREGRSCQRWNRLHPEAPARVPTLTRLFADPTVPVVAVSDHVATLFDRLAGQVAGELVALGTDGFGRSDERAALRRHFEVDAEHQVVAALTALERGGTVPCAQVRRALAAAGLDPDTPDPVDA